MRELEQKTANFEKEVKEWTEQKNLERAKMLAEIENERKQWELQKSRVC